MILPESMGWGGGRGPGEMLHNNRFCIVNNGFKFLVEPFCFFFLAQKLADAGSKHIITLKD